MISKTIRELVSKAKFALKENKLDDAIKLYLNAADTALNLSKESNVSLSLKEDLNLLIETYIRKVKDIQKQKKLLKKKDVQEIIPPTSEATTPKSAIKEEVTETSLLQEESTLPTFILKTKSQNIKIAVGKDLNTENVDYWKPGEEMNGIFMVTGGSGSGKTMFLRGLILELTEQGYPCLVLDLHGDIECDIPSYSLDYKSNVAFNPLAMLSLSEIDGGPYPQIDLLLERFEQAISNGLTPSQFSYLRGLLRFTYYTRGISQENPKSWGYKPPSFDDLRKILLGKHKITGRLFKVFKEMVPEVTSSTTLALQRKILSILEHPAFNSKNLVSVDHFIDNPGRIILKSLNVLSMQFLAADTILRQLFSALQSRGHIDSDQDSDKFRVFIIIDEVKLLAGYGGKINDSMSILNRLSTEARKFGVGLILASQMVEHFSDETKANSATKLMLKPMDDKQAKQISRELKIDISEVNSINNPGEGFLKRTSDDTPNHIQCFHIDRRPYNESELPDL